MRKQTDNYLNSKRIKRLAKEYGREQMADRRLVEYVKNMFWRRRMKRYTSYYI